jgi:hypothetical protein
MKSLIKRGLLWLYIRGVLSQERLAGLFRKHPWLRSA